MGSLLLVSFLFSLCLMLFGCAAYLSLREETQKNGFASAFLVIGVVTLLALIFNSNWKNVDTWFSQQSITEQ